MKKQILAIMMCLVLVLSLVGCGAAASDSMVSNGYAPESALGDYEYFADDSTNRLEEGKLNLKEETGSLTDNSASKEEPSLPADRKLIQKVNMSVETENLDIVLGHIDNRVQELNGYIEASNIRNGSAYSGSRYRRAEMTIRIPAENLTQFVDHMGEVSNVVSSNKTVDDVTLSYVSIESRMKALQTEEARLLELLAKAETMKDLLTVESRLTDVRTELEQVTSSLRVMDNQVNYATVDLYIDEVTEYTPVEEPETVWQRISEGFVKSLKGVGNFFEELFVFLIVGSPYFVLVAILLAIPTIVIVVIIKLIRRKIRKSKNQ